MADTAEVARAAETVAHALDAAEVDWQHPEPHIFVATLPGTRKLATTCSLVVGAHTLSVNAFVIRHPDENDAAVHRWLLRHNTHLPGVAYAIDSLGDIYLVGRLPLAAVTEPEIDRLLGVVLETADSSFNPLLELGYASAIRREWAWRRKRGESTANLTAFAHLAEPADAEKSEPAD